MAVTPHISLRVDKDRLERWQSACQIEDKTLSDVIRKLMDSWCDAKEEYLSQKELVDSQVDMEKLRKKYGV